MIYENKKFYVDIVPIRLMSNSRFIPTERQKHLFQSNLVSVSVKDTQKTTKIRRWQLNPSTPYVSDLINDRQRIVFFINLTVREWMYTPPSSFSNPLLFLYYSLLVKLTSKTRGNFLYLLFRTPLNTGVPRICIIGN